MSNVSRIETDIEQKSRLRGPLSVAAVFVFGVLGLSLLASTQIKLAGAIIATGELRVVTNKTALQHPTGGRITQINVKNGQEVKKGDVLVYLDDRQAQLQLDGLIANKVNLERSIRRLESALKADLTAQPVLNPQVQIWTDTELGNRDALAISTQIQQIITFNASDLAQIKILREMADLEQQRKTFTQMQLAEFKENRRDLYSLNKKEFIAERQLRDARIDEHTANISLTQVSKDITEISQKTASLEEAISKRVLEFRNKHLFDLIKAEDDLKAVVSNIALAENQLEKTAIKAGLTGIITNLQEVNVGSVLQPNVSLAEIIPRNSKIQAEVFVPSNTIDLVNKDSYVSLEISTIKRASEQRLEARVDSIGADLRVIDERTSAIPVILALVDPKALPFGLMRNGVPVTAYLRTQERSLAAYLVNPIIRWSRITMREY